MPGKIILEIRMRDGPFSGAFCLRIVGLEAGIEANQEVIEIKTQSQTIGNGNLPVETSEIETAVFLIIVIAYSPDIACIDIGGEFELPEQFASVLDICVEAYVARLMNKRGGIGSLHTAGA